ncbi:MULTISPECIES: PAS domain-containing sensor histidine kinase [Emticicia]|uniref:sensor histidine kinase n=1 Tax=Emticicia TaxID=312278 RepID=UPI000C76C40B|nr:MULTISPECIES: ATP-binding protein [Emticicia]PLK46028.1 histidine kinase [Emticicia sp. TH156]UTA67811.1 ATP-binding protein [Emticicia sp. 21SJ11W-3]
MRHFAIGIILRISVLSVTLLAMVYYFLQNQWSAVGLFGILSALVFFWIFTYTTSINRKLARFFESVRYSDFAVKFRSDNKLGRSFEEVNQQFNGVLEAFRQARAEKEANLHYINTIVQHVNVGLLSYDSSGNIELINNAAFRILNIYRLRNISELSKTAHAELFDILNNISSGSKALYQTANEKQISINAATVSLRGRVIKLISLQNIQSELQQKELEAWQNLTKVLRHEIMNSVTPIVSLASTMREIIELDLSKEEGIQETVNDLKEALFTIENRSKGIMNFVNAYREFTSIPKPKFEETTSKELIAQVLNLVQPQLKEKQIELKTDFKESFDLMADTELIAMVLINIIKNAVEATESRLNPQVRIRTFEIDEQKIVEIGDNGSGIEPEALEKIFIPFYTTKKTGSGIGLSLSRQIMQMHGGNLKVFSKVGEGTRFQIIF